MEFLSKVSELLWGAPMLALMLFTGGFFSVKTGFFQARHFGHCLKKAVLAAVPEKGAKTADSGSVTPFEAMCSALAATLGTGNIAGVSAALAVGGAGAVFWMWISAVVGMMTGYAENVLGNCYRKKTADGKILGGAMLYIRDGLAETVRTRPLAKPLAQLYAALCALCAFGMGSMVQTNSAAEALSANFGIAPIVTGAVLAAFAAAVMFGGAKRIAAVSAKIVPLMSAFYIIGAVWILAANAEKLPQMFAAIFSEAFGFDALGGGFLGTAVRKAVSVGLRRGVFSNEAGLGTSVLAHSHSVLSDPVGQGIQSIFEVFFDTIVMCSLTAFVLLASPCNAPTLDEIANEITLEPQYFALSDGGVIMRGETLAIDGDNARETVLRTAFGGEFTLALGTGEETFSNIMSITGIQSTNELGEPLWLDEECTRPLIETAEIAPLSGSALAAYAFSQTFGSAAGKLLAAAVTLFAFSTLIGWSGFGAQCAEYLFGERAVMPFRALFTLSAAVGAVFRAEAVWSFSDILNALMAFVNLFAVLCLSGKVVALTKDYCRKTFGH